MPANPTEQIDAVQLLSDDEVAKIEAQLAYIINPLPPVQTASALCRTVKAAWADRNTWQQTAETLAEENTALREQLAEARGLLIDCESLLSRIHQQSQLLPNTQEQPADITRQIESLIRLIALVVDVLQRVTK